MFLCRYFCFVLFCGGDGGFVWMTFLLVSMDSNITHYFLSVSAPVISLPLSLKIFSLKV